jgi:2-dehydropantoate 2-reductase
MTFTIIGAGAIGAITGAALARAGHPVAFVDANSLHVAAVRARGLHVSGHVETTIRAPITTPDRLEGPLERVLLAVKSVDTDSALDAIAPRLAAHGFVLSLQNGLEVERIAARIGRERTIGGFLTFGGHWRAPGEIVYGGPGTFRIGVLDGGTSPRILELAEILSAVQPVAATGNILGFLWAKLALLAVYFATALADRDVAELYAVPRFRALFGDLAGEVAAIARAQGIRLEPFDGFDPRVFDPAAKGDPAAVEAAWEAQTLYWRRHPGGRTGIWRDLARHRRRTEIDRLLGAVVERASAQGLQAPRLSRLITLVHEVEDGRLELGPGNLERLRNTGDSENHSGRP